MESSSLNTSGLEKTLQDGKRYRHVNALIVAHLRDNNFNQAASAVASATMTSLNVEALLNKLQELVAKGLAVEKDEMLTGYLQLLCFIQAYLQDMAQYLLLKLLV